MSSVLNRHLVAFAEYERYLRRLGLVKISSATFRRFFDELTEETAAKLGRESGSDSPQSLILAKFGSYTVETAVAYLRMLSEFGGVFEFAEVDERVPKVITLLHMYGPKGSIFFTNYARQIFEAIRAHPKISSTEHSVTIEIGEREELQ